MIDTLKIDTIELHEAIPVVCRRAESFPDGVLAAHQALHAIAPVGGGRRFFGVSWSEDGIIYLAAATELHPGELDGHGLETFTIRKGKFLAVTLTGYDQIKDTFAAMLKDPRVEPGGYCVEVYPEKDKVQCLVTAR